MSDMERNKGKIKDAAKSEILNDFPMSDYLTEKHRGNK